MYLHYVLDEIEHGRRAPLNLDELPTGLTAYYCRYWRDWQEGKRGDGKQAWQDVYAPTLGMLAAAQQPLTTKEIVTWARLPVDADALADLLQGEWRAFIDVHSLAPRSPAARMPPRTGT